DAAGAFREIARILRPGGLFVLVDNFTPEGAEVDAFINDLERLRDASHVRSHTVRGWRHLAEAAGLRTSIDSETSVTKLDVDSWLARSQTPKDRADAVRHRLRDASAAVVRAFDVTATRWERCGIWRTGARSSMRSSSEPGSACARRRTSRSRAYL